MREHKPTLRVGLAGAGMISRFHLLAWQKIADATVVAVADPNRPHAEERAREFDIPGVYWEVEEMLQYESLDAVDIVTPRDTHADFVRLAAAAGVDAICQKPLAPTLGQAKALVDEVCDGMRLMVHENWRYRPYFQQVARWIDEQRFGEIHQCRISVRSSGLVADGNGRYPALERQPFMGTEPRLAIAEQMTHHLDVARFLLGPLTVVAARTRHAVSAVVGETLAVVLLETSDGIPVIVESNMAAPGYRPRAHDQLELIGSAACAIFDRQNLYLTGKTQKILNYDYDDAYQASFDRAIAHFVDAIRTGTAFETDARENLNTLKLVEDAYVFSSTSNPNRAPTSG